MRPGQDAIYYITGDDLEALKASPQLEGFRARGVEVLLLTDPIDEFAIPMLGSYQEKPLKSVTRGGADLSRIEPTADAPAPEATPVAEVAALVARFKAALADAVKDVRASQRLTDSAVCLVADENDTDMRLERLLAKHKQLAVSSKRILEVNPAHPLIRALAAADRSDADVADAALLLLDQARIVEGEAIPDAAAFARRLSSVMARGLAA
jgi:molecular chaperone HtpG